MIKNTVKKYAIEEVALLGVFAVGLLLASIFVDIRRQIQLSQPVTIPGTEIQINVPAGRRWEASTSWNTESDNSLVLVAQQSVRSRGDMTIKWKYKIAAKPIHSLTYLQNLSEQIGCPLSSTDSLELENGRFFEFGHFLDPQGRQDIYLGILPLDWGRQLELQVASRDNLWSTQEVLLELAGHIITKPNERLKIGVKLIEALKTDLPQIWKQSGYDRDNLTCYLIKNETQKIIGYSTTAVSQNETKKGIEYSIQEMTHYLDKNAIRSETHFRCTDVQENFSAEGTTTFLRRKSLNQYQLKRIDGGELKILENQISKTPMHPGEAAISDSLVDYITTEFLQHDYESAMVDLISSNGRIYPTVLTRLTPTQAAAKSEQITDGVRLQVISQTQLIQEVYYNSTGQIIGKYEKARGLGPYLWEPCDRDKIEQIFENSQPVKQNQEIMTRRKTIESGASKALKCI